MTTDVEGDVSTGSPDLNRKRAKRDRTKNKGLKSTESFGRNLSASPVGPEHSPCSSPNVVVKSVRIPTVEAGSSKRSSERRSDFNDFEEIVIISSDDDYEDVTDHDATAAGCSSQALCPVRLLLLERVLEFFASFLALAVYESSSIRLPEIPAFKLGIDNFLPWNFFMLRIEPGAAGSRSKNANHCDMMASNG